MIETRRVEHDGMITCSTLSGKAVCRLVWAMNKVGRFIGNQGF